MYWWALHSKEKRGVLIQEDPFPDKHFLSVSEEVESRVEVSSRDRGLRAAELQGMQSPSILNGRASRYRACFRGASQPS